MSKQYKKQKSRWFNEGYVQGVMDTLNEIDYLKSYYEFNDKREIDYFMKYINAFIKMELETLSKLQDDLKQK